MLWSFVLDTYLLLCVKKDYLLFLYCKIFILPFLARGLERFSLLVAVGEAGRPII